MSVKGWKEVRSLRNTERKTDNFEAKNFGDIIVDVFVVAFFRFHVSFRECHYKEFIYANMRRSSTSN